MDAKRRVIMAACLGLAAALAAGLFLYARLETPAEAFLRARRLQAEALRSSAAPASGFRATVCAARSCVLVEAGGLAFLFGAGDGAAEGLAELGLLRNDLDGVLLPDLRLETIAGLPALARAIHLAGRVQPLKIYGPLGIVAVVDGANLMASGEEAVRLEAADEVSDQGLAGLLQFDSGVVSVRAFTGKEAGRRHVYRVDFDNKSLVLAGCSASIDLILAASQGARSVAGAFAAEAPELLPATHTRAPCISFDQARVAATEARMSAVLLASLSPGAEEPGARGAWTEVLRKQKGLPFNLARAGTTLDLSGEEPALIPGVEK